MTPYPAELTCEFCADEYELKDCREATVKFFDGRPFAVLLLEAANPAIELEPTPLRPCLGAKAFPLNHAAVAAFHELDEVFFRAEDFLFEEVFFPDDAFFLEEGFFLGTFAPARRASDSPMAIACFRLVTFFFDLPLFKVPLFRSSIAFLTFSCAFFPYLAIVFSWVGHPPI
jgi:hypothetical protein